MQRWLALCAVAWGCGGGGGGGDAPAGACTFTATIDGASWVASPGTASNQASVLGVFGSDAGEALAVALGEPATGTFTTATSSLVEVKLTLGETSWTASMGHGSATLAVTELTASHTTGSFAGTLAIDGTGSGSADASISGGGFDCAL